MKRLTMLIVLLLAFSVKAHYFTRDIPRAPEQECRHSLNSIMFPEIAFTNAPLSEVLAVISEQSIKYDDPEKPPEERGLNIVLADDEAAVRPISCNLRYVSAYDLLVPVCDAAGTRFRIDGNVILVSKEPDPIVTRIYSMVPGMIPAVQAAGDIKALFVNLGVSFPKGASIRYFGPEGRIIAANTAQNLARVEQLLEDFNMTLRNLEIKVRVLRVKNALRFQGENGVLPVLEEEGVFDDAETFVSSSVSSIFGQCVTNRVAFNTHSGRSGTARSKLTFLATPSVIEEGEMFPLSFSLELNTFTEKGRPLNLRVKSDAVMYTGASRCFWLSPVDAAAGSVDSFVAILTTKIVDPTGRAIERSTSTYEILEHLDRGSDDE